MPTVAKASGNVAKLGDLSTYTVSTAAIPYNTADTSGAVPSVSLVLAGGEDVDYLIDETLTLSGPAVGNYSGEIVEVSSSSASGRFSLSADTILSRLNSEQRVYPSQPTPTPNSVMPLAALDYWSQQCGLFYDDVPGDVLYYQSQYLHWFAFVKDTVAPVRANNVSAAGGEDILIESVGGRWTTSFGINRNLTTTLRLTGQLTVQVPAVGDSRQVVFSSGVLNAGTGRRGTFTWNFETPTKAKASFQVAIDNTTGITLGVRDGSGAYTSVGTVAGAVNGSYRFHVGVKRFSATHSTFTLNVVSSSGVVGTVTANLPSLLAGNLSLVSVARRGENQGSGARMLHWGEYISVLPALPTTVPSVLKSLSPGTKTAQFFTGFSGNVWEHIKAYCSVYHLDLAFSNGRLTVGPRSAAYTAVPNLGSTSKRVNTRDKARYVEVVNLNSETTLQGGFTVPRVMWKADSVYQVAVGETQEFLVQTDHSILELSQPVAVSGIDPFPYQSGAGQYVVTGSDGYIVSPTFWRDQGGSITVDTTENEGEIKVIIQGPTYDSPRAPYRISEGDAGRPALYITGQGVLNKPQTLRVGTGDSKAAKEVGVTVESPFIANATLAYDAAARAARQFATPEIDLTATEALDYDKPSALGTVPAGSLIKNDGNILRIVAATQTSSSVSGSAEQHNTIGLVKQSFGTGATIGDMKAFYAGKTIKQTNLKPLKVVK